MQVQELRDLLELVKAEVMVHSYAGTPATRVLEVVLQKAERKFIETWCNKEEEG
jgi:hypothetical protein